MKLISEQHRNKSKKQEDIKYLKLISISRLKIRSYKEGG